VRTSYAPALLASSVTDTKSRASRGFASHRRQHHSSMSVKVNSSFLSTCS